MAEQLNKEKLLDPNTIKQAENLLKYLREGDVVNARQMIAELNEIREDGLYMELGRLTRNLHETLKAIDLGVKRDDMPNVKNKLSMVIQLTEDAANKTIDGIEKTLLISDDLAKEATNLLEEWSKLKRRELTVEQFRDLYKEMINFLSSVEDKARIIHKNLQDVLVAQNYQDLSGQAIKKVIDIVAKLETRLVDLIRIASEVDKNFGNLGNFSLNDEAEAVFDEDKQKLKSQDQVDDLLSSLGF